MMRKDDKTWAAIYGSHATVLITGASSGLGAAIAVYLAQFGCRLVLVARREALLMEVAEQVREAGGSPMVLPGDTSVKEEVDRLYQTLAASHLQVDVAFLNAGIGSTGPLETFDSAQVAQVFSVNLLGVAYWLDHLLPAMVGRHQGVIVGMSSLAGYRGLPQSSLYSASKAALSTLFESLRLEARTHGVQVTTVEPGFVRTPMTAKNHFPMPFLLEPEVAAKLICSKVARGQDVIRFPWPLVTMMRLLRLVPDWIYLPVGQWLSRKAMR